MKTLKALRGAINIADNTAAEVEKGTEQLISELIRLNELDYSDMVCVMFSLTHDITAEYPAAVFRAKFSSSVPLFSSLEPNIDGGLPLTIRVMILHYGEKNVPVYLNQTINLRKDLFL